MKKGFASDMKKLTSIFLFFAVTLLLLAGCGKTETPAVTPTPSPSPAVPSDTVDAASVVGTWTLDLDRNELKDVYAKFSSTIETSGSEMTLGADGSFSFFLGDSFGGEGTYTLTENLLTATYTDTKGSENTMSFMLFNNVGGINMCMSYSGVTVWWMKGENPVK